MINNMIDYKLAKELKDAGFLQTKHHKITESGTVPLDVMDKESPTPIWISIPTLEELIEACGDKFSNLEKHIDDHSYGAYSTTGVDTFGKTPSEAVARLWLNIKK